MVRRLSYWAPVLLALPVACLGHASFIGYSGAPGTSGTCAGSCHGSSGGTITVSGFPASYVPGQAYTIVVRHTGGSTISQFNGSVRRGTGSTNAGTITAGTNTSTYNTSGETNGIHLSSTNRDSGRFTWTAPAAGTGSVKLYLGGLQGSYSGLNTAITQTATEQVTGVEAGSEPTLRVSVFGPNPFSSHTNISFGLARAGHARLSIHNAAGTEVRTLVDDRLDAGRYSVDWDGRSNSGRKVAAGIYCSRLVTGSGTATRKLVKLQ